MGNLEMTADRLSVAEIVRDTGKVQPAAQIRHFRKMGIRAERTGNPDAPVLVYRVWLAGQPEAGAESKPKLRSDTREKNGQAAQAR